MFQAYEQEAWYPDDPHDLDDEQQRVIDAMCLDFKDRNVLEVPLR